MRQTGCSQRRTALRYHHAVSLSGIDDVGAVFYKQHCAPAQHLPQLTGRLIKLSTT